MALPRPPHRLVRAAIRLLLALLLLPVSYIAAALVGGLVPANLAWRETDIGVTIYIETNGVHTGLLLPATAAGVDWRGFIRADHLADPRYAGRYLWIGWGDRRFFLETPGWADVKPGTLLSAAFGSGGTLMHVDHVATPRPGDAVRPLRLTPAQYRRLASLIRASFASGPSGGAIPLPGYGPADMFYEARGRYSLFNTCNNWTGSVLRRTGIRVGRWTPLSFTVMWWFDRPATARR